MRRILAFVSINESTHAFQFRIYIEEKKVTKEIIYKINNFLLLLHK
jgi:hypothetical protein